MADNQTKDQKSVVAEKWRSIRSAIQARWSEITNDDLKMIDGDSRKLVALVNQKTNMPLHEIEQAIDEIAAQSGGLLSRIMQSTSDMAAAASDRISEPASEAYRQMRQTVASRPAASLAGVFGAGAIVGLCCGLLLLDRSPPPPKWWELHK